MKDERRLEATINLDPSIAQFNRAAFMAVGMMRNTLRSIESGAFSENYRMTGYDGLGYAFELQDLDGIEAEATANAYCAVVRALIDLLDRFVAVDEVVRKINVGELAVAAGVPIFAAVEAFVDEQVEQVSRDPRFSVPEKIQRICGGSAQGAEMSTVLDAYRRARNAIEHHKGRPKSSIDIMLYSMELVIGGEPVVYGEPVEGGDVGIRAVERTRTLPEGEPISFTENDVSELVFGLMTRLVPGMVGTLAEANRARSLDHAGQAGIAP